MQNFKKEGLEMAIEDLSFDYYSKGWKLIKQVRHRDGSEEWTLFKPYIKQSIYIQTTLEDFNA